MTTIHEDAALYFRARRSHLVGPGAPSPTAAAAAILGAQAQQEMPALFAISQRTKGRPTAVEVREEMIVRRPPALLRTWAHRDTVHVLSPDDWAQIIAARNEWPQSGRKGAMPTEQDLAVARRLFRESTEPLFRRDLFEQIPERYLKEVEQHPYAGPQPIRLAATRLVWLLAMEGRICFAQKEGSEQAYVDRKHWFPDLPWPDDLDPLDAACGFVDRYLATHGPATPTDIAHFFGARVGSVKEWLETGHLDLSPIDCGERRGLLARTVDLDALQKRPTSKSRWPLRMLPKWDTHTMTHKDKSWVVPEEAERPRVWRKAGDIPGTFLARGRIVATWTHKTTSRKLVVRIQPLSSWRDECLEPARSEAVALARHLALEETETEIGA